VSDIAHEVFVKAYIALATYSFERPFAHWLAVITIRHCYDRLREQARRKEISLSGGPGEVESVDRLLAMESEERFSTTVRRRDAATIVEWALAQLSPPNRMVVTLVHLEGYSVREAADLLGWSVVNVKVRAHRARRFLRQALDHLINKEIQ
jgi:RNA polymerase sigma-70 factor (ECF subfamily)